MTDENKTTGNALALNTQETLEQLNQEVQSEFITSDREVYKEGLRSLLVQEQKLLKQKASIEQDIKQLHTTRDALGEAFKNGTLHSVEDVRGVVRTVGGNYMVGKANRAVADAFES